MLRLAKIYDSLTVLKASPHSSPENGPFPYIFLSRSSAPSPTPLERTLAPNSILFYSWLSEIPNAQIVPYSAAEQLPILTLLDVRLRDAFLLTLYIYSSNYKAVVLPSFYKHINSIENDRLSGGVGVFPYLLSYTQYLAAKDTLQRSVGTTKIDAKFKISVLTGAEEALDALSDLVSETTGFLSGEGIPGTVDAAVYGYLYPSLHLGLMDETGTREAELVELIRERPKLVELVEKVNELAWS